MMKEHLTDLTEIIKDELLVDNIEKKGNVMLKEIIDFVVKESIKEIKEKMKK